MNRRAGHAFGERSLECIECAFVITRLERAATDFEIACGCFAVSVRADGINDAERDRDDRTVDRARD
jgi:hypothetical protein